VWFSKIKKRFTAAVPCYTLNQADMLRRAVFDLSILWRFPMAAKKKKTGGTQINVRGGIHAGRDVVMGDQYNQIYQKVEQNPSPAEFLSALQQVQQELALIKQQPDLNSALVRNLEVVESSVIMAAEIAGQPEPPADDIKVTLIEAKETMDLISGSLGSAVKLGTLIGNLALLAGRVFGGF
jgi:hypothetical protein